MALPTFKDLDELIQSSLQSSLNITFGSGKSLMRTTAMIWARMISLFSLVVANLERQRFYDTASGDVLNKYANLYLGRYRNSKINGIYLMNFRHSDGRKVRIISLGQYGDDNDDDENIVVTYVNGIFNFLFAILGQTPFPIIGNSENLRFINNTTGIIYKIDEETLFKNSKNIPVITADDFVFGNNSGIPIKQVIEQNEEIALNENLTADRVIPSVLSITIDHIYVHFKAEETDEELREKIRVKFNSSYTGESVNDFILWSQDSELVKRIYPYVAINNSINLYVSKPGSSDNTLSQIPTSSGIESDIEIIKRDIQIDPRTELSRVPLGTTLNFIPIRITYVYVTVKNFESAEHIDRFHESGARMRLFSVLNDFFGRFESFVEGANRTKVDTLRFNDVQAQVQNTLTSEGFFFSFTLEVKISDSLQTSISYNAAAPNDVLSGDYVLPQGSLLYLDNTGLSESIMP